MTTITVHDLSTGIDGEPCVRDLRLAEALKFERLTSIRVLINRYRAELEQHGPLHQVDAMVEIGSGARRPGKEYWLNEAQSLLVCMFARTRIAAEVRRTVVEVFMAWRRGQLPITHQPPAPLAEAEIFSPSLIAQVRDRARDLAEQSIPRIERQLIRWIAIRLAGEQPVDLSKEVFHASVLRRYVPHSAEDEQFLASQWALDVFPHPDDVKIRREVEVFVRERMKFRKTALTA